MKVRMKPGYLMRDVAGEKVLLPVGKACADFSKMMVLNETAAFVRHLNGREDVDFVIHGGDVSDFGLTKEFEWVRDIMNKLDVPYVTLLGNHDVLGNGLDAFEEVFGAVNFDFMAGKNRFICLNTNALEFDYSHPIPDFKYVYSLLADSVTEVSRTVPVMHVAPGDIEFNNNVSLVFHELLKRFPGMEFCLHAHDHKLKEDDLFDVCNVFMVQCENPELGEMMQAVSVNDDPASAFSVSRQGRIMAPPIRLDNIASQAALQRYADRLRWQSMMAAETTVIDTALNPVHQCGDIVALEGDLAPGVYEETGWAMELAPGGMMEHTLRRILYR